MSEEKSVKPGDTLTLHYQLTALNGTEIDSTFGGEPIQLTLGRNQLAANLENCLIGVVPGERHVFQLEPWQAFGVSNPDLVQQISLDEFPADMPTATGSLIEFTLPNGNSVSGTVLSIAHRHVVVDFNHPLSDCPVLFEVEILHIAGQ